ncbi:MAG: tetratricopeptide repeat protein [Nitrospinae bacterium]|nr:tetratricopeptide repeat protein [Nitrospinota bacterium]
MNKPFLNILVISCLIFLPPKAFSIENNNGQTYDSLLEKLNKLSKLPEADRDGVKWKLQYESLFKEFQSKLLEKKNNTSANKINKKISDDADWHINLGKSYFELKQYQEAIDSYKAAIRIKPVSAHAHGALGASYYQLKQYQEAIAALKESIRITDNAHAHVILGGSYFELRQYQEAIDSYKEAIRIKPDHADAHYNLGLAYYGLKQYQEAIAALKEAIRVNPDYDVAHTILRKLLNENQDRLANEKLARERRLNENQDKLANERLAREQLLLEEERKKHQTLKKFKEAEKLAQERKRLEEERNKLEVLIRKKEIQERQKREALRIDEKKRKEQSRVQRAYSGTGFLFSSKNYVITNWHVISGTNKITVKFLNGEKIKAEVALKDPQNDIAFLKLERQPQLPPSDLKIGDSSRIKISDEVFTIGYPAYWLLGENPKYTRGEVNALSGIKDDPRVFQISVQIQPGNSGGPLFNSRGEVIGITQATLDPKLAIESFGTLPQNVNYAIKSNYISALLPMLPETLIASRGILVVPTEPENTLSHFIEKAKKNIVLIEAKE